MHLVVDQEPIIEEVWISLLYGIKGSCDIVSVKGLPEQSMLLKVFKDESTQSFDISEGDV